MQNVIKRPKCCPECGGEVCDVIWGMPTLNCLEDYQTETGHKAILGGCSLPVKGDYDYQCEDCGLKFSRLSFPKNARNQARSALLEEDIKIFSDAAYLGLFRKQLVYKPIVRPGISWEEPMAVCINQKGKVCIRYGQEAEEILSQIEQDKHETEIRSEKFYRYAAWRAIREEGFYKTVRRFGTYHGKRVYLPVYLKEFEYVPLGLPLVILVDEKGNAESIRDFLSFDILDSVKAEKKMKKQNQNKC